LPIAVMIMDDSAKLNGTDLLAVWGMTMPLPVSETNLIFYMLDQKYIKWTDR
jgi:hypothetical protein